MTWVIRILLFLLVLRLVLRFVGGLLQGLSGPAISSGKSAKAVRLERDPVCGTYIPRTRALTMGSGAETRYFCSEDCRRAYVAGASHPTAQNRATRNPV
jgi:uncharacterized protein